MTRRNQDRGLTLVEILFAMGILALGLIAFFGSMVSTSNANEVGKEQALAVEACQEVIEVLLQTPYHDMIRWETYRGAPGQPEPVVLEPGSHFVAYFKVKPPLAENAWVGEIEIRDATRDLPEELPGSGRHGRPAWAYFPIDHWRVAEITVRLQARGAHARLRTRREG